MVQDLSIRVSSPQQLITSLSGGNQQKAIVARALLTSPKVLLMDEPTRGIDVGAKAEIFRTVNYLAEQGYSVILVSSEIDEDCPCPIESSCFAEDALPESLIDPVQTKMY